MSVTKTQKRPTTKKSATSNGTPKAAAAKQTARPRLKSFDYVDSAEVSRAYNIVANLPPKARAIFEDKLAANATCERTTGFNLACACTDVAIVVGEGRVVPVDKLLSAMAALLVEHTGEAASSPSSTAGQDQFSYAKCLFEKARIAVSRIDSNLTAAEAMTSMEAGGNNGLDDQAVIALDLIIGRAQGDTVEADRALRDLRHFFEAVPDQGQGQPANDEIGASLQAIAALPPAARKWFRTAEDDDQTDLYKMLEDGSLQSMTEMANHGLGTLPLVQAACVCARWMAENAKEGGAA